MSIDNGEELVLDTSGGDVEVVVRERIELRGDGTIRVEGDGAGRFYIDEDVTNINEGNVSVPDHRAAGMWFYMKPGRAVTIEDQGRLWGSSTGRVEGQIAALT